MRSSLPSTVCFATESDGKLVSATIRSSPCPIARSAWSTSALSSGLIPLSMVSSWKVCLQSQTLAGPCVEEMNVVEPRPEFQPIARLEVVTFTEQRDHLALAEAHEHQCLRACGFNHRNR